MSKRKWTTVALVSVPLAPLLYFGTVQSASAAASCTPTAPTVTNPTPNSTRIVAGVTCSGATEDVGVAVEVKDAVGNPFVVAASTTDVSANGSAQQVVQVPVAVSKVCVTVTAGGDPQTHCVP
ncbi:hypothetical protein [Streptomyces cupreus]|uniref:Big-1 domain-containing protein n=1 Tax=Streptomyces cupreus TaxID=2759956 RepID=A0A7X1MCS6_9ACTN|nr:hypothetical protein [Streptomyces cupreus]MBC2906216.1 hypothetical protein [Streptomyces cupreus]